jgi:hypothetical protein
MTARVCSIEECTKECHAKSLCRIHYNLHWRKNNREKFLLSLRKWRENNKERKALGTKNWVENNKERHLLAKKRWKENNPEKKKAQDERYYSRRKTQIKLATPKWVDKAQIEIIYKNCPDGFEIDHIVPLLNERVCGLHVPYNLQYLTVEENRLKNNKFDPHPPIEVPKKEAA